MENQTTNRLVITEWLTLAALIIGCFIFNHNEMKDISDKLDQRLMSQENRKNQLNQRTDDLYKTFIDLVKEGKK